MVIHSAFIIFALYSLPFGAVGLWAKRIVGKALTGLARTG